MAVHMLQNLKISWAKEKNISTPLRPNPKLLSNLGIVSQRNLAKFIHGGGTGDLVKPAFHPGSLHMQGALLELQKAAQQGQPRNPLASSGRGLPSAGHLPQPSGPLLASLGVPPSRPPRAWAGLPVGKQTAARCTWLAVVTFPQ